MSADAACALIFQGNPPEVAYECARVLGLLLTNLRDDPTNEKFRAVKSTNAKIKSAVLSPSGSRGGGSLITQAPPCRGNQQPAGVAHAPEQPPGSR